MQTRLILLLSLLAVSLVFCSQPPEETAIPESTAGPRELIQLDPQGMREAGLALAEVARSVLPQQLSVPGRVTLNENATARVGSFSEGVVVECCLSVGASVQKNDVVARLHSHEVHDAETGYEKAHQELRLRRSQLEYARQSHARASRLYELKAGSLQQVQEAETVLRGAETSVAVAEAELRRAAGHLRYLGFDEPVLDEPAAETQAADDGVHDTHLLTIRSPLSGTIVERPVSPGAVVTPSDPLYVISDLTRLWVIAQVPEQSLGALRQGMAVSVSVRAYPDRPFAGRLAQIGNSLDPETRTVQVRCEVPNPGLALKTEMYASLVFDVRDDESVLTAPLAAVQTVEGRQVVFVPEGETTFRMRQVETGRQSDSAIEILSGLQAGDKVVVHGSFLLKSEVLKSQMMEE